MEKIEDIRIVLAVGTNERAMIKEFCSLEELDAWLGGSRSNEQIEKVLNLPAINMPHPTPNKDIWSAGV